MAKTLLFQCYQNEGGVGGKKPITLFNVVRNSVSVVVSKKGKKKKKVYIVSAVSDLECLIEEWWRDGVLGEEAGASIHPTLAVKKCPPSAYLGSKVKV